VADAQNVMLVGRDALTASATTSLAFTANARRLLLRGKQFLATLSKFAIRTNLTRYDQDVAAIRAKLEYITERLPLHVAPSPKGELNHEFAYMTLKTRITMKFLGIDEDLSNWILHEERRNLSRITPIRTPHQIEVSEVRATK